MSVAAARPANVAGLSLKVKNHHIPLKDTTWFFSEFQSANSEFGDAVNLPQRQKINKMEQIDRTMLNIEVYRGA